MRMLVAEVTEPRPLTAFLPDVPAERGEAVIVRSAVASTFIAALELCREAVVGLDQAQHFSRITVSRRMASAPSPSVTVLPAPTPDRLQAI